MKLKRFLSLATAVAMLSSSLVMSNFSAVFADEGSSVAVAEESASEAAEMAEVSAPEMAEVSAPEMAEVSAPEMAEVSAPEEAPAEVQEEPAEAPEVSEPLFVELGNPEIIDEVPAVPAETPEMTDAVEEVPVEETSEVADIPAEEEISLDDIEGGEVEADVADLRLASSEATLPTITSSMTISSGQNEEYLYINDKQTKKGYTWGIQKWTNNSNRMGYLAVKIGGGIKADISVENNGAKTIYLTSTVNDGKPVQEASQAADKKVTFTNVGKDADTIYYIYNTDAIIGINNVTVTVTGGTDPAAVTVNENPADGGTFSMGALSDNKTSCTADGSFMVNGTYDLTVNPAEHTVASVTGTNITYDAATGKVTINATPATINITYTAAQQIDVPVNVTNNATGLDSFTLTATPDNGGTAVNAVIPVNGGTIKLWNDATYTLAISGLAAEYVYMPKDLGTIIPGSGSINITLYNKSDFGDYRYYYWAYPEEAATNGVKHNENNFFAYEEKAVSNKIENHPSVASLTIPASASLEAKTYNFSNIKQASPSITFTVPEGATATLHMAMTATGAGKAVHINCNGTEKHSFTGSDALVSQLETVDNLTPGTYTFSVKGTDSSGALRIRYNFFAVDLHNVPIPKPATSTVTVTESPALGTVKLADGTDLNGATLEAGMNHTFKVTAPAGFHVESVSVNGTAQTAGDSYTINADGNPVTVAVVYAANRDNAMSNLDNGGTALSGLTSASGTFAGGDHNFAAYKVGTKAEIVNTALGQALGLESVADNATVFRLVARINVPADQDADTYLGTIDKVGFDVYDGDAMKQVDGKGDYHYFKGAAVPADTADTVVAMEANSQTLEFSGTVNSGIMDLTKDGNADKLLVGATTTEGTVTNNDVYVQTFIATTMSSLSFVPYTVFSGSSDKCYTIAPAASATPVKTING